MISSYLGDIVFPQQSQPGEKPNLAIDMNNSQQLLELIFCDLILHQVKIKEVGREWGRIRFVLGIMVRFEVRVS